MAYTFIGKWITNDEFFDLPPRNVFHRQLDQVDLPCDEHRDRHILFRKEFFCDHISTDTVIHISADDYYKLYINGRFVTQGPAPNYHFRYAYNTVNIASYLREGRNVIAVHTLYQGLINRVWQSGDLRHGLILDIVSDGKTVLSSDESFKTAIHSAYRELGYCGYQTQFLEQYDSRAAEVGFEQPDFDDSDWAFSRFSKHDDHQLSEQRSHMLVLEQHLPVSVIPCENGFVYDFGGVFVGYLEAVVRGKSGDTVTVRCAQELDENGMPQYHLRANCNYEEPWVLTDGDSTLHWFDYKSFRYAQLILPKEATVVSVKLIARHYPFTLKRSLNAAFAEDKRLQRIWGLCVRTLRYGVQEVIQDCMEREKGFYIGDGCYTAFTQMLLTDDDSMVRKLIDDAFSTTFITETMVTCLDCSMMQEIADYPLILTSLILWHYRYTGDRHYLAENFEKVTKLLDAYRNEYEKDGLLRDLNKWCVVEWPANFRHGYDVDIREGQVCHTAHVSINAYYINAVRVANTMADILGFPRYREEQSLLKAFYDTFYVPEKHLFRDGENTDHISLVGNTFPFAFNLCPDRQFADNVIELLKKHTISSLSLFCVFPMLCGLLREDREDLILECLSDENAWLRILREDGTTTFEGWGKDTKWNTSLFHLTMSYVASFMTDTDVKPILI